MERLTTKRKDGRWALKNDDGATPWEQINKVPRAIDRLAAYEDTGLEPEEVKEFLEDVESRFVLWINKRYGIPAMKFMDIMQAEKDGRLVVLPVPVGTDKVAYGLTDPEYGPQRVEVIECICLEKLRIWDNHGHEVVVEVDGWEIGESDIGKTVFLTREEAEAALKKRRGTN